MRHALRHTFLALALLVICSSSAPAPPPKDKLVDIPSIYSSVISPDGSAILVTYQHSFAAAALLHSEIVLFDASSGKELWKAAYINLPTVFLPDGNLLSGGINNFPWSGDPPPRALEIINRKDGKVLRKIPLPKNGELCALAVSPDGTMAVTGFIDSRVLVWDLATGDKVRDIVSTIVPLEGPPSMAHALFFSADGKRIHGFYRKHVSVWETATGKPVDVKFQEMNEMKNYHWWLGESTDAKLGCTGVKGNDRVEPMLAVWDMSTGKKVHFYEGHTDYLVCAGFAQKDKKLISVSLDKTLRQWDVASGKEDWQVKLVYYAYKGAIAPDGKRAFLARQDGTAEYWDLDQRKVLWQLPARAKKLGFPFSEK